MRGREANSVFIIYLLKLYILKLNHFYKMQNLRVLPYTMSIIVYESIILNSVYVGTTMSRL